MDRRCMVVWNETNEAIYIGSIDEIPHRIMAIFRPVKVGFDSELFIIIINVEERNKKWENQQLLETEKIFLRISV